MAPNRNIPHRASGLARCTPDNENGRLVVCIELVRGDEIGFAIGALSGAGFRIVSAKPRRLIVLVGRRRLATITKALRAIGFSVTEGGDR